MLAIDHHHELFVFGVRRAAVGTGRIDRHHPRSVFHLHVDGGVLTRYRRHFCRLAPHQVFGVGTLSVCIEELGQPEVEQLHFPVIRDDHVTGLNVAV